MHVRYILIYQFVSSISIFVLLLQQKGVVKLFDFGFARSLPLHKTTTTTTTTTTTKGGNKGSDRDDDHRGHDVGDENEQDDNEGDDDDAMYHMTARMGTWRYMAPEVARGDPYNAKCDVYSLALIYWEMVVGSKPYGDLPNHSDELRALVTTGSNRPALTNVDENWKAILERAWHPTVRERSTVQQIHATLQTQLDKIIQQGQSHQYQLFKRQ